MNTFSSPCHVPALSPPQADRRVDPESDIIGVCRTAEDCVVATIRHADGSATPIPHIVRHSPDGFEFGYGGSGLADLALSILTALVGAEMAVCHYQDFKWLFIATKSGNGFTIPVKDIFAWLAAQSDSDPDGDHACEDLKAPAGGIKC